jgi:hypothetical protein
MSARVILVVSAAEVLEFCIAQLQSKVHGRGKSSLDTAAVHKSKVSFP